MRDDGFIIIIALQDCGSPFYAIAGYEAQKYTFFKNTFKEWIIWRHLAFAHTQYIMESSTSFSVVCLSAAKDACSVFINIKPVIRHFLHDFTYFCFPPPLIHRSAFMFV